MASIPQSVCLSMIVDLLYARAHRLRNRLERNPRRPAAGKTDGRQQQIDRLEAQARAVQAMKGQGDMAAETAGLLLAWASGHQDAIARLEEIEPGVEQLHSSDIAGACRLLIG